MILKELKARSTEVSSVMHETDKRKEPRENCCPAEEHCVEEENFQMHRKRSTETRESIPLRRRLRTYTLNPRRHPTCRRVSEVTETSVLRAVLLLKHQTERGGKRKK